MSNYGTRNVSPGEKYGQLTVIEPTAEKGRYYWLVECSCGKRYAASKYMLLNGHSKSCGCTKVQYCREGKTRHGHTWGKGGTTPEYRAWLGIKNRCYDPKNKTFAYYGGRGIVVCDRWRDSFEAFLEDMGPKPGADHSIERIDNDKLEYAPDNCRWATRKEQCRNQRSNRHLTVDGVTRTVGEWAEITGLGDTLYRRLYRGWDAERAVKESKHLENQH